MGEVNVTKENGRVGGIYGVTAQENKLANIKTVLAMHTKSGEK